MFAKVMSKPGAAPRAARGARVSLAAAARGTSDMAACTAP